MPDDQSPNHEQAADETEARILAPSGSASKSSLPPAVGLAFVIIALLGVMIVMVLKNGSWRSSPSSADLATLQAEANALRSEYNRERVAMGLRPVEGDSEAIEEAAGRVKKDADTLVAMASSYQRMLAEKDSELTARNAEILRLERLRQSLSAEITRLQGDLQRALVNGSDIDMIRRDLADLKAQRDALAAELGEARQKNSGVSAEDYADVKRQLEETQRAKEFFEARVQELQGELTKALRPVE